MDIIKITGTDDIPSVILDSSKGIFEISGKSMPEDVVAFYNPILEWMDIYLKRPNNKTVFDFKLSYFNTASSKMILDILLKLEEISSNGNDVLARWYFKADDEDMEEAGDEYFEIVEIPFEKIAY